MKQRTLKITYIDHRQDPPAEKTKQYTDHRKYLQDMRELMNTGGHQSEQTESVVHIYPESQGSMFEQEAIQ